MLMMRRRAGESILIGADISIYIAHIGRSRVKIAIDAPKDVKVLAREVAVVEEQNRAAAASALPAEELMRTLEQFRQASTRRSDKPLEG